ncbi:MAG: ROK family protein [Halothiobacillus sp.]|jgi:glucokinase|nr:ROK family protein [Halothiobacillus sp.]
MLTAGVDIGCTNIEVGLVNDKHEVVDRAKKPTPKTGPKDVVKTIVELIESLEDKPLAAGVGISGAVDGDTIVQVPNLENWDGDYNFIARLRKALGMPVAAGNDANVGLLGEWLAGAAKGYGHVLGVWMGTGIGGALILEGRPYTGSLGSAGEIGHVVVRADGALCGCGRRGCVEAYAGRERMSETVKALQDAGRKTSLFEIEDEEDKTKPTSKVWAKALEDGDKVAKEVFEAGVQALGIGIGSVLNMLNLERVVIGGGMAEKFGKPLARRVRKATLPWVMAPNPKLDFVVAKLGDDSGVIGAAELGRAVVVEG